MMHTLYTLTHTADYGFTARTVTVDRPAIEAFLVALFGAHGETLHGGRADGALTYWTERGEGWTVQPIG